VHMHHQACSVSKILPYSNHSTLQFLSNNGAEWTVRSNKVQFTARKDRVLKG
jgi:hypothetical protein